MKVISKACISHFKMLNSTMSTEEIVKAQMYSYLNRL